MPNGCPVPFLPVPGRPGVFTVANDKGDACIMPRFVPGTAVRIPAPWLKTNRDVARSRRGLRVVASAPADKTGQDGSEKD